MHNCRILIIILLVLSCFTLGQTQSNVSPPEQNFDHLWHLFNKSYASFEEKEIDWKAVYNKYRPEVNGQTTDEQLFAIFEKMLKPLNDAHVVLKAKSLGKEMKARRPSKVSTELASLKSIRKGVTAMNSSTLKEIGFKPIKEIGPKFNGNKLFAYTNNSKVGYLRFYRSFSTMVSMNGVSLNSQLDEIFETFDGLDALIIDIRFNMGGTDGFSDKVVGRLIEKEILSHYQQTKKDVDEWTELKPVSIKPSGSPKFLKDVYLITNDRTVSAADVLTLAVSTLPNVTIVGDRTNGSFSDIYARKLPNGWSIELSNERYLSTGQVNYEGVGVPVDVEAHTTLQDVQQKNDSVLKKVMALIQE